MFDLITAVDEEFLFYLGLAYQSDCRARTRTMYMHHYAGNETVWFVRNGIS